MRNLTWPVVLILGVCMVVGQVCFVAAQYTLAQWSYKSPFEQRKPKCAPKRLSVQFLLPVLQLPVRRSSLFDT